MASDPTLCRAFALLPSELISSTPFEVLLSGEQVLRGLQRKWSAGIISTQFNAVWAGATAEERVRLLSLRCPLGGAWLQGRVGVLRQLDLLGADEFRTAIRHRLGLPLCASESVCACGATRDVMGRHDRITHRVVLRALGREVGAPVPDGCRPVGEAVAPLDGTTAVVVRDNTPLVETQLYDGLPAECATAGCRPRGRHARSPTGAH